MRLAICCLAFALAGCSLSPRGPVASTSTEKDQAAIDKLRVDFATAFDANDSAAIARMYSADGVLMPEGDLTVVGRAAIQQYFKSGFDQVTMKATLTADEVTFMGTDWAYARGTYAINATPKAGGKPTTQEYRYLTLMHREADGWKMKRDTYNIGKP